MLGDRRSVLRADRALREALRVAYADPDEPDDPTLYEPDPATLEVFRETLGALDTQTSNERNRPMGKRHRG